jgi:hypothetical protein
VFIGYEFSIHLILKVSKLGCSSGSRAFGTSSVLLSGNHFFSRGMVSWDSAVIMMPIRVKALADTLNRVFTLNKERFCCKLDKFSSVQFEVENFCVKICNYVK